MSADALILAGRVRDSFCQLAEVAWKDLSKEVQDDVMMLAQHRAEALLDELAGVDVARRKEVLAAAQEQIEARVERALGAATKQALREAFVLVGSALLGVFVPWARVG